MAMKQEAGAGRQAHDQEKDGCAGVINDAEHVKPLLATVAPVSVCIKWSPPAGRLPASWRQSGRRRRQYSGTSCSISGAPSCPRGFFSETAAADHDSPVSHDNQLSGRIMQCRHAGQNILLSRADRGQFGYRKLLYYKGFPGVSTPVFMVSVCSSVKIKGETAVL